MEIAAGMKDITQDIASSYEARITEVGRLKEETKEMLGSFQASHREMSSRLRRGLVQAKAKMGVEVRAMRNGFQTSHKEMSAKLKKDLAQGEAERKQTSAKLKTDLVQGVTARKSEGKGMRNSFQASHKDMSAKLKKDLAQGEAERKHASAELKKDLAQGVSTRKSEVKAMRNGFQATHNEMRTQLRKDLANYDHGIKSKVSGMRQETRADLREARAAWQELASVMQGKRGGAEIPLKAEALVAEEEIPDLEAKMLAAVNEHPEGITLAGIADSLGVVPVVLGRVSRSLLDKGEIRKEEKLYFPIGAE